MIKEGLKGTPLIQVGTKDLFQLSNLRFNEGDKVRLAGKSGFGFPGDGVMGGPAVEAQETYDRPVAEAVESPPQEAVGAGAMLVDVDAGVSALQAADPK